ncbi:hypothetical protein EB796_024332 [Bugula neritina]|uniref:N4BP1 C-terminal UBA domain-containing protein n=1 Tax=Bugula neritina TaxID=10212 RepID=A0A7J7IU19_BUGNE|nr:hypothetical protein EB796_024332 [Bugula neritina]
MIYNQELCTQVPQASTMRPAAQQVPPSHRNVPFSSNQIPRPSSSMPPAPRERTANETQHIMGQLLSIFPERREDIIRLISRHPHEKSVDAFVDSLL